MECSKENTIPNNQKNYIFKHKLEFKGVYNSLLFYYSQLVGRIYCIQLLMLNGQMKLLQKFRFEKGKITFIPNSNQIIFLSWHSIQIWKVQNSQKWSWMQTITRFEEYEEDLGYNWTTDLNNNNYKLNQIQHDLNTNGDLLVFTNHLKQIQFWVGVKNDWKCEQTIEWNTQIKRFQFNSSNSILLAHTNQLSESKLFIFHKDIYIGQWIIIHKIDDISLKSSCFCFQDNETLVYIDRQNVFINFCQILQLTHQVKKISEFKMPQNNSVEGLSYQKSQNLLIAYGNNFRKIVKKKNGIYYFQPVVKQDDLYNGRINNKGKIWFINCYSPQNFHYMRISIKKLYEN